MCEYVSMYYEFGQYQFFCMFSIQRKMWSIPGWALGTHPHEQMYWLLMVLWINLAHMNIESFWNKQNCWIDCFGAISPPLLPWILWLAPNGTAMFEHIRFLLYWIRFFCIHLIDELETLKFRELWNIWKTFIY